MPRSSRQHSDTGVYHVMLRGIDRQDIFADDQDRGKLHQKNRPYFHSYAGTDITSIKDWQNNIEQLFGKSSNQYTTAIENAKVLYKKLGVSNLTFVGHSLGGGLAAASAYATGGRALTFNAAGVGDLTKIKEGSLTTRYKSENSIEAYILRTDPLNIAQNSSLLMPDVNGRRHYLWPRDLPSTYNGHSIDSLFKCFGVSNPGKYNKSK